MTGTTLDGFDGDVDEMSGDPSIAVAKNGPSVIDPLLDQLSVRKYLST
jgi:hypothetical protein